MKAGDIVWVCKVPHYPHGPHTIQRIDGNWIHLDVKPAAMKTQVFSSKLEAWEKFRDPIARRLHHVDCVIEKIKQGDE